MSHSGRLGRIAVRALFTIWCLAASVVAMPGVLAANSAASAESGAANGPRVEERVEEVLRSVDERTRVPDGIRFSQHVTLRALLFRWQFTSRIHVEGEQIIVETEGAPSFVPETIPQELVQISTMIRLFDLEWVGEEAATGLVVLKGPRVRGGDQGAQNATFWIDAVRGIVVRAEANYPWGVLKVEQDYFDSGDYSLLRRQFARLSPHGATLDVEYRDYVLP